jgi:hypothetical protein
VLGVHIVRICITALFAFQVIVDFDFEAVLFSTTHIVCVYKVFS